MPHFAEVSDLTCETAARITSILPVRNAHPTAMTPKGAAWWTKLAPDTWTRQTGTSPTGRSNANATYRGKYIREGCRRRVVFPLRPELYEAYRNRARQSRPEGKSFPNEPCTEVLPSGSARRT